MGRLFGTDGVRGVAGSELGPERAMAIGRAAASVLSEGNEKKPLFIIGSDTRISSEMLGAAVAAGVCAAGADVLQLGVVPTPAVAFLVKKYNADAGIMISASHNPYEYNGIKIFNGEGFKLPDELEEKIEELVLDRGEAKLAPLCGASLGRISRDDTAFGNYLAHLMESTKESFAGLKIVIDCANGSSARTAEKLFRALGANVTMLADKPNGININDGCGSTHMESLTKAVTEGGYDCGLAFDGDADRFLAVDEKGELVDGDGVMAICALDMKKRGVLEGNTVVGTIMTNFGFIKFCEKNGLRFVATKVGDRFVLEEMLLEGDSIGGEQSGHIIFRDYATTGDGQLTAIQLLSVMVREKKSLSELASVMTRSPQTMINLRVSPSGKLLFYTDSVIKQAMEEAQKTLGKSGRLVVRPSGTEPLIRVMTEGEDGEQIKAVAEKVADVIRTRLEGK